MLTESVLKQAVEAFDLSEHAERLEDRERDASLGLLVMVIGAGNFGKSSLINALCGKEVAPVSVIPKTFKIDVFAFGPADTALVRKVGEPRPREVSHIEARMLEEEYEQRFKQQSEQQLAEIVWQYEELNLPREISLVDTPGISQALGKSAKGLSLASVLGTTFEVDQVWARWFHRADVVIWAFSANKMEDADTRNALEAALSLFDKPVIPVATKADLIPQDRWPEVHARFNSVYGPLLKERQAGELILTVSAGKNPKLTGTGIPELRSILLEIAGEALVLKRHAESAFIRDASYAVSQILDETAKLLVANLRSIAMLGDFLAEEAIKEAERGRVESVNRVNSYLREVARDPKLYAIAKLVHELTKGGRSGDVESEARQHLNDAIDKDRIAREVDGAFQTSAHALESTAQRLCQGTEIAHLTFQSSGKMTRHTIPMRLELRALAITSTIDFTLRLPPPAGLIGQAWDAIKRLFGIDRYSVSDIHEAMAGALQIPEDSLHDSKLQALYEGFAPALLTAVETSLLEHIQASGPETLELLAKVDAYLPLLNPTGTPEISPTYGPQAEYWSTLTPGARTLLNLAREELTRLLPQFREILATPFETEPPQGFQPFREVWARRQSTAKVVSVEVPLRDALRRATTSEKTEDAGPESSQASSYLATLVDLHLSWLQQAAFLTALDSQLAKCVEGVRYRSAGARMAQVGSQAFQDALESTPSAWKHTETQEMLGSIPLGKGTLVGSSILLVITLALFIWRREWGYSGLAISAIWVFVGYVRPFLTTMSRYEAEIGPAIMDEIRACQRASADRITAKSVDTVLEGMAAELAPRPLQSLLFDARLVEH